MFNGKISLTPEEIYEKEFKVDARGYRPQEVDKFLDAMHILIMSFFLYPLE